MNTRKNWEDYDITDYHRLSYIGDNVNEILTILLKNLNAGVGLFEVGETIRALYLNDAFFRCIGYSKETYVQYTEDIYATLFPEDVGGFESDIREHAPHQEDIHHVIRGYKEDGSWAWFEVQGIAIENKLAESPIYLTVLTDITAVRECEAQIEELKVVNSQLLLEQERYKILEATAQGLLFEYTPQTDTMVFSYNLPGNKKRKELKNYSSFMKRSSMVHSKHQTAFKKALLTACLSETEDTLEYLSSVSGGGYRWHRTYYKSVLGPDGKVMSVIGRIEDIHDDKMKQEMLHYRADRDGLTNLYRKEAAFNKMQEYVNDAPDSEFYLIILDLDDFKQINDKYGHQYGDKVLKKMADKLNAVFDESCILGRFGGDEFLVLTKNMSCEEITERLEQIRDTVRFCAGIVPWKNNEDIHVTFDRADQAMYHVKMKDKNGIHIAMD